MKIIDTIAAMRNTLKPYRQPSPSCSHQRIGLVPTMGAFHPGHLSLMERARQECDIVVTSIFVNPLQFAPNEDFDHYPRNFTRDATMAKEAGVDFLFHPTVEEMVPPHLLTTVNVTKITEPLCGASRSHHFTGVATVVTQLFHIVQPDTAYFGLKDAQQVAVIQQMVRDLHFPITVVPCAIVREADGLAMSSRNVYLSREERKQALILHQTLTETKEKLLQKEFHHAEEVNRFVSQRIKSQPLAEIDYVETLTYPHLEPVKQLGDQPMLVAVAVRFGKTRLLDNLLIE
jgi:pantoate--beta-alanine ligase